jgi:uncharacterized protein
MVLAGMRRWLRTLLTLNGTPRGVAGGFALGLSLSLVPIPFAGMFVALAMAPLLRCNLPATYAGSAVVNPFTGPFIYFAELWLGLWVMGRELPSWARMQELDAAGWWETFEHAALPFMLGAGLCCVGALLGSFPLLWWLVARWQAKHPHPPADPATEARAGDINGGDAEPPGPARPAA